MNDPRMTEINKRNAAIDAAEARAASESRMGLGICDVHTGIHKFSNGTEPDPYATCCVGWMDYEPFRTNEQIMADAVAVVQEHLGPVEIIGVERPFPDTIVVKIKKETD